MIFNYTSTPNSRTYSNLSSNISIEVNPGLNDNINLTVSFDSDRIGIIDENFTQYLGNDGKGIYYLTHNDTIWYSDLNNDRIAMIDNDFCSGDDCTGCKNLIDFDSENDEILVYNDIVCIADKLCSMDTLGTLINCTFDSDNMEVYPLNPPLGYFIEEQLINDNFGVSFFGEAVGDIDLDGLDEIIVSGQAYDVIVANPGSMSLDGDSWGTMVSGFSSSFDGEQRNYLISDLLGNNPDFPEIISFPSDSLASSTIDIISYNGNIIEQFPASNFNTSPYIISNFDVNATFIVHGNRTIRFDKYNSAGHYWHNIHGTTYQSNSVGVSRQIHFDNYQNWQDIIETESFDFNQAFNYPNPFQNNTVFKFYIAEANNLTIKIYSIAGFLIDEMYLDGLINHQFNEYSYNAENLLPGLYIAELKSNNTSKIIKLLKSK